MISFIGKSIPIGVLFALLALLPIGLILICLGRRKRRNIVIGMVMVVISIPSYLLLHPLLLWGFDTIRGWELSLPVSVPNYNITLVQKPGCDMYDTWIDIIRSDGKKCSILSDADDSKWWNPKVVYKDGKIYFLRGSGEIDKRTPFIDPSNDMIWSGGYGVSHTISDLEFK